MKETLKIYWPYLLLIPFVLAGIVGWFILPAEIAVEQAGEGMPKLVALLVPVALSAFGSAQVCYKGKRRAAGILILVIAAVAEIMIFAGNL